MEKEISTYLLKVYCGSMSNRDKGAYAVDIIANDIGIKDTDLLNVFMSDTKKADEIVFDDDIIWMFTNNAIIKFKSNNDEREYSIIPVNNISNIRLKISKNNTVLEFIHSGNNYSLNASADFNREALMKVYHNTFDMILK